MICPSEQNKKQFDLHRSSHCCSLGAPRLASMEVCSGLNDFIKSIHICVTQLSLFFFHFFQTPSSHVWRTTNQRNLKLWWKASGGVYYQCAVSPMQVTRNFFIRRACIRTHGYTMYKQKIMEYYLHFSFFARHVFSLFAT